MTCACLKYANGSLHLCEGCAEIYRAEHEQLELLRGFTEKVAAITIYKKSKYAEEKNQMELYTLRREARYAMKAWDMDEEGR